MQDHLEAFAAIARDSKEYQGHGWGCAWFSDGWHTYHNVAPVWEDPRRPGGRARLLLAHARSAFRDEGICVENNMPFFDGELAYIFNGELRGVRIRERGRIGAEKIFNFIKRFDRGDTRLALERGLEVVARRTRCLRAANVIMADSRQRVYLANIFNEDPDYYRMWTTTMGSVLVVSSEPYAGSAQNAEWAPLTNGDVMVFQPG